MSQVRKFPGSWIYPFCRTFSIRAIGILSHAFDHNAFDEAYSVAFRNSVNLGNRAKRLNEQGEAILVDIGRLRGAIAATPNIRR